MSSGYTMAIPFIYLNGSHCRFPHGLADAANASGKKGSNDYELNQWLWEFWRGKPRLGGQCVTATEQRSEGATRLPRRQDPVAKWNEDNQSISLIQIFEIEISMPSFRNICLKVTSKKDVTSIYHAGPRSNISIWNSHVKS